MTLYFIMKKNHRKHKDHTVKSKATVRAGGNQIGELCAFVQSTAVV